MTDKRNRALRHAIGREVLKLRAPQRPAAEPRLKVGSEVHPAAQIEPLAMLCVEPVGRAARLGGRGIFGFHRNRRPPDLAFQIGSALIRWRQARRAFR